MIFSLPLTNNIPSLQPGLGMPSELGRQSHTNHTPLAALLVLFPCNCRTGRIFSNELLHKERGQEGEISQGKVPAMQACQPEFNPRTHRKPSNRCKRPDVALWTSVIPPFEWQVLYWRWRRENHPAAPKNMHVHSQRCRDVHTQRHAHRGNTSVFKLTETETEKYMPSPESKI